MSWLFESIDWADHEEASKLCDACPALEACDALRLEEIRRTRGVRDCGGGPVGTWAGQFMGAATGRVGRPRLAREHGTDRGYFQHRRGNEAACGDCLDAHNAAARVAV